MVHLYILRITFFILYLFVTNTMMKQKLNMLLPFITAIFSSSLLFSACQPKQPAQPETPKQPWGVQLYSLRSMIGDTALYQANHKQVFDSLKRVGYDEVELYGYEDGKFFGIPAQQFVADLKAAGLRPVSSHVQHALTAQEVESGNFTKQTGWWQRCIQQHKNIGVDTLVYVWYEMPKTQTELQRMVEYMIFIGAMCHDRNIAFGYHNHAHELGKVDDVVVLDYLIEHTPAELLFCELDVYWAIEGGANPVDYFNRYPGRFKMLHLKDQYEIGQSGKVDFRLILENTEKAGAQHLIVEQETTQKSSMLESLSASIEYLLKLKIKN